MQTFTGFEYLLIDLANQYGHDKMLFDDRISWAKSNLPVIETLVVEAENKPLFVKALQAIRAAQAGTPIGHLVGFDAVCSGVQLMSVLAGCVAGSTATGLVDPNTRADAYSALTKAMQVILGNHFSVSRKDAKQAFMTTMYGSKRTPKRIFGEDTPELNAFYKAANEIAPGACELLQDMLSSWQSNALVHAWKMPDGFDVRVKVMTKVEARIEVDELDHATFAYEFYENLGQEKGLSNAANITHSVDAYVLRSIHRRCNYDYEVVMAATTLIDMELVRRANGVTQEQTMVDVDGQAAYYVEQYERSGMPDIVILPHLDSYNTGTLTTEHLQALSGIANGMLEYFPFEVVTIHDEFKCHPNNMNHLRQQYINILAELADSNLIEDILSQLHGRKGTYPKLSNNLSTLIRKSNYALS